jgi:DNA polymerase-3 subunit delta'
VTDSAIDAAPEPAESLDLIGHEEAERAMAAAASSGRMPHAWLIGGPPGVGKETLAYRLARFLLTGQAEAGDGLFGEAPQTLAVDAQHPVVRRIAAGGHGDLLVVRRTANEQGRMPRDLSVEAVRRIHPFLALTPAEGGWRVVILDEAHTMTRSAANAVLKVLEEPPDRAVLIMTASNPGALLPTIRSRVRQIGLKPLEQEAVRTFLDERRPDLTADDAALIAAMADGAPGQALRLADEEAAVLFRELTGMLARWPRFDPLALHGLAEGLSAAAADDRYRLFAGLIDRLLADLVRSLARGEPVGLIAAAPDLTERLGAGGGVDRWMGVWEKVRGLLQRTDQANLDRRNTVLQTFLTLEGARVPA